MNYQEESLELSETLKSLFNIEDEFDLVERPVLMRHSVNLMERIISSLEMLIELSEIAYPEIAKQHKGDLKFFQEYKFKLECEMNNVCVHFLSGTYH